MSDLIRCSECEGWGVTAYEKDGTPIKCERCAGSGQVERPAPPVYPPSARELEREALLKMAEELKDSKLSDVSQLAQAIIDYIEDEDFGDGDF